ncbi:probable uracil phosphoribosyltransferase, putative [Babesia ovata]|uniref:Probable uracil phosphoribosyltransferase, putative n=1 Tax=Babesia ovata TaxID=189622 RepID=A0A2H6K9G4_9APIC|nr:probable uracil phosphoribosyltransferase, putative [Babesia ovata]GBE59625.1 probable uracil phosphoribosyltransferase, putative [Babesia ovata]
MRNRCHPEGGSLDSVVSMIDGISAGDFLSRCRNEAKYSSQSGSSSSAAVSYCVEKSDELSSCCAGLDVLASGCGCSCPLALDDSYISSEVSEPCIDNAGSGVHAPNDPTIRAEAAISCAGLEDGNSPMPDLLSPFAVVSLL